MRRGTTPRDVDGFGLRSRTRYLRMLLVLCAVSAGLLMFSFPARAQGLNQLFDGLINQTIRELEGPPRRAHEVQAPPRRPSPASSSVPSPSAAVRPASRMISRNEMMAAQRMLREMGYDAGTADGLAGPKTLAALNAFQRDHGIAPTAWFGSEALADIGRLHAGRPQQEARRPANTPRPAGTVADLVDLKQLAVRSSTLRPLVLAGEIDGVSILPSGQLSILLGLATFKLHPDISVEANCGLLRQLVSLGTAASNGAP